MIVDPNESYLVPRGSSSGLVVLRELGKPVGHEPVLREAVARPPPVLPPKQLYHHHHVNVGHDAHRENGEQRPGRGHVGVVPRDVGDACQETRKTQRVGW